MFHRVPLNRARWSCCVHSTNNGVQVTSITLLTSKTDEEVKAPPSTIVNVPQDTPESMKDAIRGLEDEFDGLANRAADDIEQSIKGGETKLARVKSTITRLPVTIRHHHVKFLAGKLSAINKAESVNELFSILDLYWDFINCGLLERLTGRFGSTQRLDIYLKRLKDFRVRTTVREFTGKLACYVRSRAIYRSSKW